MLILKKKIIYLEQSLAKDGTVKSTKSNKKSEIMLSDELKTLLEQWQEKQTNELINMGIKPDKEQFIFTYTDNEGNINSNIHIDYLNYRLNTMKRKYPNLAKLNTHKLRHTFATLAREGGADMDVIRNTLGHSDRETTSVYVDRNVHIVDLTAHDSFSKVIKETK
ncbi:MAG TPA: site-specific integrase [Candidatus Enterococcus avicola]|uniref:Site-specific integrase n=1 Tax=Candidatus Enterococcus avicola TaxID=2838561 RepID=A0A9D2JIC6_9ENTE|nr:site-specific integrase [Candidatus Enterococcus avicola]